MSDTRTALDITNLDTRGYKLAATARMIQTHDVALKALRTKRNNEMRDCLDNGYSEREVAVLAGVSSSFVHTERHK